MPTARDEELVATYFFGSLVEVTAVELLFLNIHSWMLRGWCRADFGEVSEVLSHIKTQFPSVMEGVCPGSTTLLAAANILRAYRNEMLQSFCDGDKKRFSKVYRVGEPTEFIVNAAASALPLLRGEYFPDARNVRIKVLVDECDYLVPEQQQILNALVRKSRAPIDWIAAFVPFGLDPTSTIFPNLTASVADRLVVDLDAEPRKSFERLCQQVTAYRVFYSISAEQRTRLGWQQPDDAFPLKQRLGDLRVNHLIDDALKQSVAEGVAKFTSESRRVAHALKALSDKQLVRFADREHAVETDAPAYYQCFALASMKLQLSNLEESSAVRSAFISTLRRKQRGAFLRVLAQYGVSVSSVPYAGYNVILSLADGCIRDFLDIMASIFDASRAPESAKAFDDFCFGPKHIDIKIQRDGARRAAENKYLGIRQRLPSASASLNTVIDALGRLTRWLQVDGLPFESSATEERGVFIVDLARIWRAKPEDRNGLVALLDIAKKENLIVFPEAASIPARSDVADDLKELRFRLHKRFAPKYGFSYAGALEPVQLDPSGLIGLLAKSRDSSEIGSWVVQTGEKINASGRGGQGDEAEAGDLFDGITGNRGRGRRKVSR